MTYGWLDSIVQEKLRTEWLDLCWLSLIPEMYGVNIAVWEPTGRGQLVQLYKKNMWGLFMFDKEIKHDEEGQKWVHLFYRSGSSWEARTEVGGDENTVSRHIHFDFLELGADFEAEFDAIISVARSGGEGDGETSLPSPVPVKRRRAAGSAETTLKRQRTSTKKSQLEDDDGPLAQSKRKRTAKSDGGSKKKQGPSGESKGKSGGGGAAGSTGGGNYDSDGSIGDEGTDWTYLGCRGALPSLTRSQQLLRRKLNKIPEPAYKAAFKRTSIMKAKAEKVCYVSRVPLVNVCDCASVRACL
ncbi:unnamed protein product [Ectocarpus sp. CCAP 1310/34]|nr:unnamed protein product [Ectocarpus sp. CCAP 1310/34]